ncbi:amino acid racemase [Antribacter sp. KLBMP9083]|uniref:Amino acid racemase n=1 Tax=Antribacter soli TaxID=2910976 RepID=A0AA41QIN9_9MICO|nr:amino acid racemase [Antribacter soli]MCF4123441.1 amino acid racemase [Antribacter soli]
MPDVGAPGAGAAETFVGVLGGVGPLATVLFMERVVRLTDAARDQDHVDMGLQHATVPDRTAFVLGRSVDDPGPVLAADARRLAGAGAAFLVLPCNTAHAFAGAIAGATSIPLLSAVDVTVSAVLSSDAWTGCLSGSRPEAVGLLATEGTIESGVYVDAFSARGIKALVPDVVGQATVTSLIYDGVKAGRGSDLTALEGVVANLRLRGAGAIVLGCTELSVAAAATPPGLLPDVVLVDALDELARATVLRAGRRLRADGQHSPMRRRPPGP